jgi:N-acetylneuraminic acid mutarotase
LDINKIISIFGIQYNLSDNITSGVNMPTAKTTVPVYYNGKIYYIGGSSNNTTASTTVYIYDIASNSWTTGAVTPSACLWGCTYSLYNGKIYCICGYTGSATVATTYIYDIATNTWSTGTASPSSKDNILYIVYNGKIYCIGGWNGSATVATNHIYDIASNTWTTGTAMPAGKYAFSCSLYNSKIYCIGGLSSVAVATNYIYDIASNTWTTGTAMPAGKYSCGYILNNGKIYCIGGVTTVVVSANYIYDIASNTWTTGTAMPTAKYAFGCQLYNGKIYCVGGLSSSVSPHYAVSTIYIYDIANNIWSSNLSLIAATTSIPILVGYSMYIIAGLNYIDTNNNITCIANTQIYNLAYTSYSLTLPSILATKSNEINILSDGTKVFCNDGTYKSIIPAYNNMSDYSINSLINELQDI